MRLLYVTGLAPSTASLSGTASHASVSAHQAKKKALSVKAFDPSGSNAFTLRAIFHFLPCCLTAVGCLQVPGRTPEPKAHRIVSFWHVCACMLHTVHVLLLTILALLDSLLVLQVCANQIAQPAHHSRVSAAEHGQGPLNCVAQHCCLTCCQPCLQRSCSNVAGSLNPSRPCRQAKHCCNLRAAAPGT